MALGFRLFGLRDYAGRLPLGAWALTGALVLYLFLRRFVSPRAALYGVVALSTMPLYFMQARTMLGDAVTLAAFAAAVCGLGGALLERGGAAWTTAWVLLGLGGCAAGFLARGAVLGVAAPALAVGIAWLALRFSGRRGARFDVVGVGALALTIGAVALAWARLGELVAVAEGTEVLRKAGFGKLGKLLGDRLAEEPVARVLGFAFLARPPVEATFDLPLRELGHALYPWSAFLPFAFGRLLALPPELDAAARERELGLRALLVAGVAAAFAAHAWLGPYAGHLAYAGPALCAAVIALALVDLERGAPPSPLVSLGTVLFVGVLCVDFLTTPSKAFSAFAVAERDFPKLYEPAAARYMAAAAAGFAVAVGLCFAERGPEPGLRRYLRERRASYEAALRTLGGLWRGNFVFGVLVVEAALVGLGAMLFVGRRLEWAAVLRLPSTFTRYGLNLWWELPVAAAGVPVAWDLVRFAYAAGLRVLRLPRTAGVLLGGLFAGGLLCFGYYPGLAAQISPKEMFESYDRLHAVGEPLGVVGVSPRAARYYARGDDVVAHGNATAAYRWLVADASERRWLVVRALDLPDLNALHRRARAENLPVLDARSSQFLLASNELGEAPNQSYLEQLVVPEPAELAHPVDARFEDELEALGWEVRDDDGALVAAVVPQRAYHLRFYYRVLRPITRSWKAFLHVDGGGLRHNGDHDVLGGRYRVSLWQPGDVVCDDYELDLDANFTPGRYRIYYGFFIGNERYAVTRGAHQDNRVDGGELVVR
ncbi:MAG: glycosyltransferase family 39 protein [Polyangiaceae bacterium]|nr:glycosyltransferase family 39 protein [Polyangiaceae bacterium]